MVIITPLDAHLTLNAGTVVTSAGRVTAGNGAGDPTPAVQIAALAPGASATITFAATVGQLPPALRVLSTQSNLTGGNFPLTVSDDPSTPAPLDPTTTPVGSIPTQVMPIPTLGSWGIAALALALATVCLRRLRPRPGGGNEPGRAAAAAGGPGGPLGEGPDAGSSRALARGAGPWAGPGGGGARRAVPGAPASGALEAAPSRERTAGPAWRRASPPESPPSLPSGSTSSAPERG